jgi:P22_AR N-terminal domain
MIATPSVQGEWHHVTPLREETTVSDTLEQTLILIEQATVSFYGRDIIAVRLADGRIAAALRTMCEALQLDHPGQVRRIREDEVLADRLMPVRVETDGGPQVMEMLTAWAIPTWLTGIQIKRVVADKREAILAFKRDAADALYGHFSHPQPADAHAGASTGCGCAMVKRLHDVSGAAFASIYAELGKHFHVAKYGDIPDTAWPQIAAWFQRRITAEQRHRV